MTTTSPGPSAPRPSDVEAARMAPDALATYLRDRLEQDVTDHLVAYGQLTVTVAPAAVPRAAQLCRDDPRLDFDFFDFMSGVDEREDGIAVIIHLYSTRHRHHIQIRALADGGRDDPRLPTISHLYRGANWHERETYDMFGVTFDGHPGLLPRILTVENFEGFPLRKEFLLMSREVKPWPGLKEPKEVEDESQDGDGDGDGVASTGPSAEEKARMAREKAERAKAKAAEARKRRARERAEGGEQPERAEASDPADDTGEVSDEKAAAVAAGAGDDEVASDPQQAAAVADDAVAKDAAAGAVGGDTAEGAPGDEPGKDQPVEDPEAEAELASGGEDQPSGTPGIESEGRHEGAEEQSGDQPASETPEMASDTQEQESGPAPDELPGEDSRAGGVEGTFQDDAGGTGLPPRGPGEEEPRALAGDGVDPVPLADEVDASVTATSAARRDLDRPVGTDADDRVRRLEETRGETDVAPSGGEPVGQVPQKSGRGAMSADRAVPEGDEIAGAEDTADVDGGDQATDGGRGEQAEDAVGDDDAGRDDQPADAGRDGDVSGAEAVLGHPVSPDDLTVVEGIDAEVAQVLSADGITTWRELADTDADRLREILDDADGEYTDHDPSTWPQQADQLARGEWNEFKALTGQSDGGQT